MPDAMQPKYVVRLSRVHNARIPRLALLPPRQHRLRRSCDFSGCLTRICMRTQLAFTAQQTVASCHPAPRTDGADRPRPARAGRARLNIAPAPRLPGASGRVEHQAGARVDLTVGLVAPHVLHGLLDDGHAQHDRQRQERGDRPAVQGLVLSLQLNARAPTQLSVMVVKLLQRKHGSSSSRVVQGVPRA